MGTDQIDRELMKEWDTRYMLHQVSTVREMRRAMRYVERVDEHFIYYSDGSRVLDMMSGNFSCINGLRHPKVMAAVKRACDEFGFVGEGGTTTRYKARASKLLMEDILGPDNWAGAVRWVGSGSEAAELALQIARLYANRPNVGTREWEYHGWTAGADACTRIRFSAHNLCSGGEPVWVRDVPGKAGASFVIPGHNCYRCSLGHRYPGCKMADGRLPCIHAAESIIRSVGVESVAAIITETMYGTAAFEPVPEYFPQLRQMTRDLGILWIDDEVMMGFGRLGSWFGYQAYGGAAPDIMALGKSVSSSQLPVGGVVVSREIADFFGQNRWNTGGTFFAHPVVMAAVEANLEDMLQEGCIEKAAAVGAYLGGKLRELEKKHRCVGQVSGRGCYWAVEMVKDRQTREPFIKADRNTESGGRLWAGWPSFAVTRKAAEKGVNIGPFPPNASIIAPNCTTPKELLDMACEALDYGLSAVDQRCD